MFTSTTIMTLLMIFAAITTLLTQAVKAFLDEMKVKYASNIVVLVISLAVGCGGTAIYYVNYRVPFNALNSVYLALMGIANWMGSTLGYDKVRQTIEQIKTYGK